MLSTEPITAYISDGTQVTISLGSTVYGAQVDVLAGTMRVDRAYVDMGTLTWGNASTNTYGISYHTSGTLNQVIKLPTDNNHAVDGLICSVYKTGVTANNAYMGNATYCVTVATGGVVYVYDPDHTTETGTQFASVMSGIQLVYPLAQPVTVPLTPEVLSTLKGQNSIWSDTGDTTVEYRADTKLYVDSHLSETSIALKSILTSVEAEMKATKNYTSGQTVIVGDNFYKLTANVANGSNFTPGTNCTKVTMAEWILSIV